MVASAAVVVLCCSMTAQQQAAVSPSADAADPRIAEAIKQVSAERIQQTIEKLVSFGNRSTISAQDEESVKAGKGVGAARDWIKSEFERYSRECGGCLEVKTDAFIEQPQDRIKTPTQITNVYAVLHGSDAAQASRIVLVTGHYDSRNSDINDASSPAPGANDDASGTAVSLECARVLSKHRFPATIIFLAVAGEEEGLYGSAHFADMAKAQGWEIEAVLNNDIVGGDRTPGRTQDAHVVRIFSEGIASSADQKQLELIRSLGGESDSPSRQLARYIADVAAEYFLPQAFRPLLVFRHDRYLRGGDHFSFNREGFAAVRFTEFQENYNHQHENVRTEDGIEYGDLPKFVDYDYTANVARLNAATLASLAAAPAPPLDVRLLTKKLENESTLKWQPSPGGLATGYEVLWRDTTAADWQHAQAVGNVTTATLPLSKDNVIFAVRAAGARGDRSLAVVPLPER